MEKKRLSIKEWSEEERPREKFMVNGGTYLSNTELLAIIIGSGSTKNNAIEIARTILRRYNNSLREIFKAPYEEFKLMDGIGVSKAVTLSAVGELVKRTMIERPIERDQIVSSKIAAEIIHPLLDADFTEGKRAGQNQPPLHAARDERVGICLLLGHSHVGDDLLVAGRFNIPAKQDVGDPDQRIEPIDGEKKKTERLPQVVFPFQMGTLMSENVGAFLFVQAGGQIDPRTDHTQNERRLHLIAKPGVFLIRDCFRYLPPQPEIADQPV